MLIDLGDTAKMADASELRQRRTGKDGDVAGTAAKSNREQGSEPDHVSKTGLLCAVLFGLLLICAICMGASYSTTGTLLFENDDAVRAYIRGLSVKVTGPRKFTPEELAKHDGSNPELPLLLAFKGKVYDVSAGAKHYGKGKSYNFFLGKDATRAYVTGNFKDDLNDNLDGLDSEQLGQLDYWENFYNDHQEYVYVGDMVKGRSHPDDA